MKQNFILGGYFLVIPASRADYMSSELVPEKIVTVSDCICDIVPGTWALEWVTNRNHKIERVKRILKINDEEFLELEKWVTEKFDEGCFGWTNGFAELSFAKEFQTKFLSRVDEVFLLAIGLTQDEADIFIEEEKPLDGMGETLIYSTLSKGIVMEVDNNILGFDVLGFDTDIFHSYLCNGLEKEFFNVLNIKSSKYGLIDSYDQALKAADYISYEYVGAEPAIWQPWVVCMVDRIKR